jgi:crotonobetainyl-CoA:carnitine CoA-transferase CaiB-like acyl-CoA transferase
MTGTALLEGVRVVDVSTEAAAYTGRMFADFGADVVLVEPPSGSSARRVAPNVRPGATDTRVEAGDTVSAHFAFMAAGKRSVTIDLTTLPGQQVFRRLVDASDVLVTDAAAGEMEALGLGYEALLARHPGLVYTSVTPFGLTGPRRHWRGSDLVGWAASGALPAIGDADRAPLAPGGGLAYMTGALNATMGAMGALMTKRASGRGQLVDVSLQEAVLSVSMEVSPMVVLEGGFDLERSGKRRRGGPIGHYATEDGAVSIVAYMPEHWDTLAAWIREETGVEEVTSEAFAGTPISRVHYHELVDLWIEGLTSRYRKQAFFEEAQRRGITVAPVNSALDLDHDAHLNATDGWGHGAAPGIGSFRSPTPPIHVDGRAPGVGATPGLGEHNHDVFVVELGLTDAEVAELRADGVI